MFCKILKKFIIFALGINVSVYEKNCFGLLYVFYGCSVSVRGHCREYA